MTLLVPVLLLGVSADAKQSAISPRLREGTLPAKTPLALGGGEVVLELAVDASGTVTRVNPLRVTRPYSDILAKAAASWRFEPAAVMIGGRRTVVPGQVLVVAVFRPPSLYAGPTAGAPAEVRGLPSPSLPQPESLAIPPYPPNAVGDGMVLVEIEMTARAEPRDYRVLSNASAFDGAALDAVRVWRFTPPRAPDMPDRLFVYAVLGFRAPLAPIRPREHERSR